MGDIATAGAIAFRDYVTDGVPSSGAWKPRKVDIRDLFKLIDNDLATRTDAIGTEFPASRTYLRTAGFYAAGDGGGGLYFKVDNEPAHEGKFQSADNAWWELMPDLYVSVRQFGAKADLETNSAGVITVAGTDALSAFEDAAEFCRLNGRTLWIPSGKYRLSDTWTIDCTGDNYGVLWSDYHFRVIGDGRRATYLFWDAGAINGLVYAGSGSGTSLPSLDHTSQEVLVGMTLIKADRIGIGLSLTDHFHASARDLCLIQWNVGLQLLDVHEATLTEVISNFNNIGGYVAKANDTQPNLITLINCTISNNVNHGLDLIDVAEFKMLSGSIESNGVGGLTDSIRWGVRLSYDAVPIEGVVAASFDGVRFEGNDGDTHADIYYANGVYDMALTVMNCDFNRDGNLGGPNTRWCKNNIKIDTTGAHKHHVNIIGCGFKGYNSYTPDAGRPYVAVVDDTQDVYIYEAGNHYDSATETPDFGALGLGRSRNVATTAWGVASDAVGTMTLKANVASCTKNSTGNYTILFKKSLALASYHVSFNPIGSVVRQWAVISLNAAGFTVQFWDNAAAAADTQFSFATVGGGLT